MNEVFETDACVYAGDLREMGFDIQPDIPDCAWIHVLAIEFKAVAESDGCGSGLAAKFELTTTEPFRWVEITGTIPIPPPPKK